MLGSAALVGCDAPDSNTNLIPDGPPQIMQLFAQERILVGTSSRVRNGLAHGDHPQIENDETAVDFDDRTVSNAVALGNQQIRIVVDELLVGNALEELACADGTFSPIPPGTTPDDIADCAGADLSDCVGPNVVCIGADGPIGVRDENEDGAADDFRMIDYGDNDPASHSGILGVQLVCDGVSIPLDPNRSFYNPAGNQQIPAGPIGINGLGPALILVPTDDGLRTSASCTVQFADQIVDKDGENVCASASGQIIDGRYVPDPCDGGRTDMVSFDVEPLEIVGNSPGEAEVVAVTGSDALILFQFNAAMSQTAAQAAFTLTENGTVVPLTIVVNPDDKTVVRATLPGGYSADSDYVLTLTTGVTDVHGGALPEQIQVSFTSRTN